MSLWHKKEKLHAHYFTCLLIGILYAISTSAQVHTPQVQGYKWLHAAEEQFFRGNYLLSIRSAQKYISYSRDAVDAPEKELLEKAHYFIIVASLKSNNVDYSDSAALFIANTTNPAYKDRTAYVLAQYYFSHNQLSDAIRYYEMAGISNLSNTEVIDEKFELAYCYFSTKQFDKSEPLFVSIKELQEGKYYTAGNYYYGLLAYNENNYKDALTSFERIKDLPQYKSIVPYYIAEIYYYTGDRKKALSYSVELMGSKDKLYYDNELHLLAGQCLFEDQNYNDALPYFEYYYEHTDKIRKEDLYEMSYCYYKGNEWDKAIEKFKLLSNTRDSLGQSAMYLLGDCYLKSGDKKSARNAFGLCAEMPFNPGQQEAAMMLHARLSYEMGYNDVAIVQLNNLLSTYPSSSYRDEAKTLLSDLLIKTNNYTEALAQLNDVSNRNKDFLRVYQKVTYGHAIQLYQKGDIAAADSFLTLSLRNPVDKYYEAAAYFWKGEFAYKLGHYSDAIIFSQLFLSKNADPTATLHISATATAQHAYLNMGYAAMEQEDFINAQAYFNHAKQEISNDATASYVATVREADAVFMQKDYGRAITLYDQIIASHSADADYATFQKTKLLGLQGKKAEKTALLLTLVNSNPPSRFVNSARYELALEYIEEAKYPAAIAMLQPLTESSDARAFAPKAWMKMAFAYQQSNSNEKAINAYKHIVTDYQSSTELPAALDAIRSIYIQIGQPDVYTEFLKHNNIPIADSAELDSTYYSAAETQFASSNWAKAREAFTAYLQRYPKGIFALKAYYYRAESNTQLENYEAAIPDYDAVLQYQWNDFSENSALQAATISYRLKKYDAAIAYYTTLRSSAMSQDKLQKAYSGLVKASYNSKKYTETISYTDTLATLPGVDDITLGEAMLFKAKALQAQDKQDDAVAILNQLDNIKYGVSAAEARYLLTDSYFKQGKLKEAETAANANIRQSGGYDYWIIKSYILLADILTKEKDYFNAKATLQSIVKNSKIPELKEEAAKKLEQLKKIEKNKSKLQD